MQGGSAAGWPRAMLQALLDLLFPRRCVNCGVVGEWLCPSCLTQIPLIEFPVCPHCGRPMRREQLCSTCRDHSLQIDGIRSVAYFEGPLREAVHHLKYRGMRAIAEPLGALMAHYWREHPLPAEVIVPVPLHPSRQRERGYNQAALLARHLGAEIGLPVHEGCLIRERATAPQVELTAEERRKNVQDAFRCLDGSLAGKRVLLVDDVCTTGSTLEACAVALRQGGVRSVWALTLGRAR